MVGVPWLSVTMKSRTSVVIVLSSLDSFRTLMISLALPSGLTVTSRRGGIAERPIEL